MLPSVVPTTGGSSSPQVNPVDPAPLTHHVPHPVAEDNATVVVDKVIRKEGGKWVLYTKDGKKKLGTHDSKEAALKQERAIYARRKGA